MWPLLPWISVNFIINHALHTTRTTAWHWSETLNTAKKIQGYRSRFETVNLISEFLIPNLIKSYATYAVLLQASSCEIKLFSCYSRESSSFFHVNKVSIFPHSSKLQLWRVQVLWEQVPLIMMIAPNSRTLKGEKERGECEKGVWRNLIWGGGECWLRGNGVTQPVSNMLHYV